MEYIKNKELTKELELFNKTGKPSEKLGKMFLLIATNLSQKPNFSGYTFKDDMIGEAVMTCVRYGHNFDPNRKTSAFSYITQICWMAFLTQIKKSKKHSKIKDVCVNAAEIINNSDTMTIDYTNIK